MAFRRRDILAQLWRVATHVLHTHPSGSKAHSAAFYAVQTCLLPSTCLLPVQTYEWTLVAQALKGMRQVERCRLFFETAAVFSLDPRDPLIGKGKRVDLASRLAVQQGNNISFEVSQLQKKAYMPKSASAERHKVRIRAAQW